MASCWPFTLKRSFCTYGSTIALPPLSIATPTTVKPRSWYFLWNSIKRGISVRQGPHHVAQKLTNTTLS